MYQAARAVRMGLGRMAPPRRYEGISTSSTPSRWSPTWTRRTRASSSAASATGWPLNGLVLFTTHGRWSLENLGYSGETYDAMRGEIERDARHQGFAFVPYHHYAGDDYGMTWHSADYLKERIEQLHGVALELVLFEPQGLDGRQDVFAYRRAS